MYYGNNTVGLPSAYYNKDNRFGTNWWRLDDGEGTTPDDTIGTDDGIFQNSPTWTEGKVGGALDFDGNSQDDHVEMQNFDTGSTFIVSGWVKGGGNYQMPWGIKVDAPVRSLDQFHYLGTISNNIYDSASNSFKDGGSPIAFPTDDLWHHYVWENIGGGSPISKLWLDGQLAGIAIYRNPTTTDNKFQLSCCPQDDNYHWDGQIDDVRIFSYGLSQYDVDSIYNISAIPTSLNDEQDYGTVDAVKINLYDVDGGIVPHAFVSLINAGYKSSTRFKYCNFTIFLMCG